MFPVVLQLGPITIYSYGVMMALGFVAAGWVLGKEMRRRGRDTNLSSSLILAAAVGGLVGARLLFIFEHWGAFVADPWSLLVTGAGFTWYGGLLGGVVGVTWYVHHRRLPWLDTMDALAPGIALGHGVGRFGCHLAGDGDWGPPTALPWGVAYRDAIIGWDYPAGVYVHPTPLYETLAYVLIFGFLWSLRTHVTRAGALFGSYLVLAGFARFGLEFVRVNVPFALGLSLAQWISVGVMAAGAGLVLRRTVDGAIRTSAPQLVRERRG